MNKIRYIKRRPVAEADSTTDNKKMILSQAKEAAHHISEMKEVLAKDPKIDAWVVAKMQDVSTGLSDITHYLDGQTEYANGGPTKSAKKIGNKTYDSDGFSYEIYYSLSDPKIFVHKEKNGGYALFLGVLKRGSYQSLTKAKKQANLLHKFYNSRLKAENGLKVSDDFEEFPDFTKMSDEEIITFANTLSYYDRMDEEIDGEFTDIEDAREYLRLVEKGEI